MSTPEPVSEETSTVIIPTLSDDIKSVLQKSDDLADALQSLQSTVGSLKFYSNKLIVKLRDFAFNFSDDKPTQSCRICYVRNKTHVLVPCGHSMCELCVGRCQRRKQCFVCRGEPTSVLIIFV